jgi:hypothetical protein
MLFAAVVGLHSADGPPAIDIDAAEQGTVSPWATAIGSVCRFDPEGAPLASAAFPME